MSKKNLKFVFFSVRRVQTARIDGGQGGEAEAGPPTQGWEEEVEVDFRSPPKLLSDAVPHHSKEHIRRPF